MRKIWEVRGLEKRDREGWGRGESGRNEIVEAVLKMRRAKILSTMGEGTTDQMFINLDPFQNATLSVGEYHFCARLEIFFSSRYR